MKSLLKLILIWVLITYGNPVCASESGQGRLETEDTNISPKGLSLSQAQIKTNRDDLYKVKAIDNRLVTKREVDLSTEVFIYFLILIVYGMLWYKNYLSLQNKGLHTRPSSRIN